LLFTIVIIIQIIEILTLRAFSSALIAHIALFFMWTDVFVSQYFVAPISLELTVYSKIIQHLRDVPRSIWKQRFLFIAWRTVILEQKRLNNAFLTET
jgi:hypothetical protein